MDADWIYGKRPVDLNEVKELKVKLPLKFHVKLHSLKLLRGKTMSGTVAEALEAYFRQAEAVGAVATFTAATDIGLWTASSW